MQTILDTGVAIGHYAGVDNSREVIEFLSTHVPRSAAVVSRPRCPERALQPGGRAAVGEIFTLLRRYLRPDGHPFFPCFLDDAVETFEDRSPDRNGGYCVYHPAFLGDPVAGCGWREVSSAPPDGPLIASAFVCRPA